MDLKQEVEWKVIGEWLFIQYTTGKIPRAFLIKDEKFAKAYQEVFDNLWKIAK